MNSNSRITNYISTTKDENNAIRIISQIKHQDALTVHGILCKFMECSIIKQEPEFIEILFQNHSYIVQQMVEWMLTPKTIAKRKKVKSNLDFFPYRCKEFMKDNIPFYQHLYLYARNKKISFNIWFNFLRKQFYDKQTILTALGYFAEVMVPFARYEFSASNSIAHSFQSNNSIQRSQIISIMKILPKQLIQQIIEFCHFEPIFQFVKTAILVSVEDPQDYQICKSTFLRLLQRAQTPNIAEKINSILIQNIEVLQQKVDLLQNVSLWLKQIVANIQPGNDMQFRMESMILIALQSKIIPYSIRQILETKFCCEYRLSHKQEPQSLYLSSSLEYSRQSSINNVSTLTLSRSVSAISPKSISIGLTDIDEEDLVQILIRLLSYCVEIFTKIPKTVPIIRKQTDQIDLKQMRQSNYRLLISAFHEQMQFLLTSMETMAKIVYCEYEANASKIIPFSSGQKIKAITMMKFEYIQLMQKCLVMIQYKDGLQQKIPQPKSNHPLRKANSISFAPFQINFQKLHFIEIVQKYLNQNRWNNIVHHQLQKICHSLIVCNYEYLRKSIDKDKNRKITQTFLAFLIENFTQRDYIFLNTFKFTTQGNLQSIYNISKDLAYTLNSTNQLMILLNEFEPWKKFILNDLKLYEQKTYPISIKPSGDEKQEQTTYNQVSGLKVDEADTIKKLIQNISTTKKWPTKIHKSKGNSKSGIVMHNIRNSDDIQDAQQASMTKSHGFYLRNKKQPIKKSLNDLVKKRIQQSIQIEIENQHQFIDRKNVMRMQTVAQDHRKDMQKQKEKEKEAFDVFKNYAAGTSFGRRNSELPK